MKEEIQNWKIQVSILPLPMKKLLQGISSRKLQKFADKEDLKSFKGG